MSRKISRIVVHHSENKRDTFESVKAWQTTKDNPHTPEKEGMGWAHVAYHYVIEQSGKIFVGANEKISAGGTSGHSSDALEVCLCGDFDSQNPTPEALNRLHSLLANWCRTYKLTPNNKTIVGHKEIQPMKKDHKNKCPGENLLALLPRIRNEVHASLFAKGKAVTT
jgi:N-acetyl-anhydromuramyl-L-alanine amidase AmpD